ncbi:outer membrane beta-barrel protein [Dysgonomonas sp. ZJ279]|uniref:outer membrane beta-barrel protein n=1 Tax=Dysgonomonas sp. ZJ279 TaxID=2709796 RepID=UPI0013EC6A51|nr:outer membrane beta-barrel protein [Dysgonomonas sp. ZJ279]
MKRILTLSFLLSLLISLSAQGQATTNITGAVFDDATREGIELAGIRVLAQKDSTYVTGTATDSEGKFSVAVKPARYILQVSFLGYNDQYINVNTREKTSVGNIYLKENSIMLSEAVVTAKAVEMQVKGDTLEYNADSYKVQESAVVEDLLKKMPGVEVSAEGKITVNGKEVKKILVDGKEFFSDDPKVASKNLPAQMVDKLQVVDRKSDMSQMTGFDDGDEETVINLTVKPGMKQGLFGSAFAGIGNEDRYEANGMVNYMRNKTQMTALGGVNNTNNAGFSDFASDAFSGNRPRGLNFGGNNGVTKSINGGFNFATEHSDKLKWNGDVRYGSTDNDVSSVSKTRYTGRNQISTSDRWANNKSDNFGANLRFEWTPDSLTKIIFRPSIQYNANRLFQETDEEILLDDDALLGSNTSTSFNSDGKGTTLSSRLEISRKLNDNGRVLSFSFSGGLSDSNSDGFNYFHRTYGDTAKSDSILDQRFAQDDQGYNWRAFMSYVEPLSSKLSKTKYFLQLTYNIRNNHTETDRNAFNRDEFGEYNVLDDEYTRNVRNDFINQNVSLNFKSVAQKYNYTFGLGLEPSSSKTDIKEPGQDKLNVPRKHFLSFAPNAQFNYLWSKRHNLRIDYNGSTSQPSTLQLYNGIISNDGINTTVGNPKLSPSFQNRLNIRFQKFNPEKASVMMLFSRFTYTMDDIVTISTWNGNNGRDITYQNIDGNMSGNLRFIYNTPLRNKKFSINTMTFGGYELQNTYIDGGRNRANILNLQESLGLQFRSDKFDFTVRGNLAFNSTKNTSSTDNDQQVYNYGGYGSFTYYLPFDFTLDSDMQYSSNAGFAEGFHLEEWLWNASLAKQIFKAKNGTIRFKMYDILDKRANITRNTNATYIEDITTSTIQPYFMVNFVYKFQIFKGGAKSSDMTGGRRRDGFDGPGPGGRGPGGGG